MKVLFVRNVNEALPEMLNTIRMDGIQQVSRNGMVLVHPQPVTTVYQNPTERVLFGAHRDANPFFHLMEAMWMLRGRRDVKSMHHYVRRMAEFSDDGETFHGAYGYRWRYHFGGDQLERAILLLSGRRHSRRAVIQMWDCGQDLREEERGKDLPCNLIITPWVNDQGLLDMTVFCRSNDIIWGASGTNAVHFPILQEYLAARLYLKPGRFYQISNNFHAYLEVLDTLEGVSYYSPKLDLYATGQIETTSIVEDPSVFDDDLRRFWEWHDYMLESDPEVGFEQPNNHWGNSVFPDVLVPMATAYDLFRNPLLGADRYNEIFVLLEDTGSFPHSDWLTAARMWMGRRRDNEIGAEDSDAEAITEEHTKL